jgi:aspartyl-tRNA synthetase
LKYGSDKPDFRNPLVISDVTDIFERSDVTFNAFKGIIEKGGVVRAIRAPKVGDQPRSFFDKLNDWARGEGAPGLGYILFANADYTEEGSVEADIIDALIKHGNGKTKEDYKDWKKMVGKGPIAKFLSEEAINSVCARVGAQDGDAVFFICDMEAKAAKFAGRARDKICDDMGVREQGVYKFRWIVDFPMYETDEKTGTVDFSHNPFSMPRGGMDALNGDPLTVIANQYDCVCNGFEICSGGIRNHRPEIMEKAFAIAGYDRAVLEKKFGGMLNAFRYGAPPHGGCAFGIDRIVMILAHEPNLREVYAFVMNGAYEDQMMGSPSEPTDQQMKDLHIKVVQPVKVEQAEKKTA